MAIYEPKFLNKPTYPDWSNVDVPQYEWVDGTLYRNAWRTYRGAGQSQYQREGREAVARRTGDGIEYLQRPTADILAFVGHDMSQPYLYQGEYWMSQTGADVQVDASGQTLPEQIMSEYDESYEEARQANLQRYEEGLELLGQMGEQRREDIGQEFTGLRSRTRQELVSRGLTGTTVLPTLQTGISEAEQDTLGRLEEQLLQQRLNWVEARTDTYPDVRPYLQLLTGYGRYGEGTPSAPNYRVPPAGVGGGLLGNLDAYVQQLLGQTKNRSTQQQAFNYANPFGPAPSFNYSNPFG